MRPLLFIALTAAAFTAFAIYSRKHTRGGNAVNNTPARPVNAEKLKNEQLRLNSYAASLQAYAEARGYNNHYCFLVDMKLQSGEKRFFIYDLQKDSVLNGGLVAHGSGSSNGDQLSFSNVSGSLATSLGKYKIGASYNGKFGLAYKLYGLETTNSNAFERFVVLHAHPCVPADEVAPYPICESWGCPTVAPSFLNELKTYLDDAGKPVLLQIFY